MIVNKHVSGLTGSRRHDFDLFLWDKAGYWFPVFKRLDNRDLCVADAEIVAKKPQN